MRSYEGDERRSERDTRDMALTALNKASNAMEMWERHVQECTSRYNSLRNMTYTVMGGIIILVATKLADYIFPAAHHLNNITGNG